MLFSILLAASSGTHGFQIFDPETDDYALFPPYATGFVGVVDAPNAVAENVNEGSPSSTTQLWANVPQRQICPSMVGPLNGNQYFCRSSEFGYCDRRTGMCHCRAGYQGIDCGDCTPSHYLEDGRCRPKRLCPSPYGYGQCSGAGTCNYTTGECACEPHRIGEDCAVPRCHAFHSLCEECTDSTCLRCLQGYFFKDGNCLSCTLYDPRCHACDDERCLGCVDPLLTSIRRSGRRSTDPPLPDDELRRELSQTFPYGTQDPAFFDEAEPFRVVGNQTSPLRELSRRCDQVGYREWNCTSLVNETSHVICGHEGTISWSSPTYEVREAAGRVRLTARRTGGGVGTVSVRYALHHVTTTSSDLSPTAEYTLATTLTFDPGVVELSFLVSIHDDRHHEDDETAIFELFQADGGATLGPQKRTELTIIDDDAHRTSAKFSLFGGDWRGVAGEVSNLAIAAYSGAGNQVRVGGSHFLVELEPIRDQFAVTSAPRSIKASVWDLGNGTYLGNWTASAIGDYRARAWLAVKGGLRGEYYDDVFADDPEQGRLVMSRIDRNVNFDWRPVGQRAFGTIRWLGRLRPVSTGSYTLIVNARGDGLGVRLWLDGRLLIDSWRVDEFDCGDEGCTATNVTLVASKFHELTLELRLTRFAYQVSFEWESSTVEREPISSEHLYYLDEVSSTSSSVGRVVSAATSADETYARGDGLVAGEAGQSLRFEVLFCDRYGNRRDDVARSFPTSQAAVAFHLAATSAQDLWHDGVTGLFANLTLETPALGASTSIGVRSLIPSLTFSRQAAITTAVVYPTIAGLYRLDVLFTPNGSSVDLSRHISGSPFFVRIHPAKTFAALSRPSGPGLRHVVAGERAEFLIVAVDALDNERNVGGDAESFEVVARFDDWGGEDWSRYGSGTLADWELRAPTSLVTTGSVRDAQNGTYMVSLVPTIAGKHTLTVAFNGLDVMGSPFSLFVTHSTPAAQKSTAEGKGLSLGVVNISATFVATVRDTHGNPVPGSEFLMGCSVVDTNVSGTCRPAAFGGNGSALCTYTPVVSGESLLAVTYDGTHIEGSPFSLLVKDGSPHGPASFAVGSGLHFAEAGVTASFSIFARDAGENLVDDVGVARMSNFTLDGSTSEGDAFIGGVVPNGSGEYIASFNATVAGEYLLNVRDGNTDLHIAGSPFSLFVAPTVVNAFRSSVSGRGVESDVVSCRRHPVIVTANDRFGNRLRNSTDIVYATVRTQGHASNGSSGNFDEMLTIWGQPLGAGDYDLSYEPRIAGLRVHEYYFLEAGGLDAEVYGEYDLTHLLGRRVDKRSLYFEWGAYGPFSDGPDSHMNSVLNGTSERNDDPVDFFSVRWTGLLRFPADEEFSLKIEADGGALAQVAIDGIVITGGAESQYGRWQGSYRPLLRETPQTSLLHSVEVSYQHATGESSFVKLSWMRTSQPKWTVIPATAFYRRVLVANTTYQNFVFAGVADPRASTVVVKEGLFAASLTNSIAVVEVRDACGNLRGSLFDSDPVAVVAYEQGADDRRVLADVSDHRNSTYTASLRVSTAGDYTFVAVVGTRNVAAVLDFAAGSSRAHAERAFLGAQVRGSPWTSSFFPGPMSVQTTWASGIALTPTGFLAGTTTRIVIESRDAAFNAAQSVASAFTTSVAGKSFEVFEVLGVGRYAFDVTLTIAGEFKLKVAFDNIHIAGSPYTLVCRPGPTAAANTSARGFVPRVALAGIVAEPSRRFVVQSRDAFGNLRNLGGSAFVVSIRGRQNVAGIADDRGDGTYAIRFSSRTLPAGFYEVHVQLAEGKNSLNAAFYGNDELRGDPVLETQHKGSLVHQWGVSGDVVPGAVVDQASVRWTGFLLSPKTAAFEFDVETASADDISRIFIDHRLIFSGNISMESIDLVEGTFLPITVEFEMRRRREGTRSRAPTIALFWASDTILRQLVPGYYMYASATPISGSPFHMDLVENSSESSLRNNLYVPGRRPEFFDADLAPNWLREG